MGKRKTQQEFELDFLKVGSGEYRLLSQYMGANEKIEVEHLYCGHSYFVRANKFLQGNRCSVCVASKKKKTQDAFVKEVFSLTNDAFEVIGQYIDSKQPVEIKHRICGNVNSVTPANFLSKGGYCKSCSGKKYRTAEMFAKEVEELTGDEYIFVSEYEKVKAKMKVIHSTCGHLYEVAPKEFLKGIRCPKCAGVLRKTHEQFLKEFYALDEPDYKVLSEYQNASTNIRFFHSKCKREFSLQPRKFLAGGRCQHCYSSKGETLVAKILQKNKFGYEREFRFSDCSNINPLPFDFAVKNEQGEPIFLIEYDGIQHYKENDFFGGREAFLQRLRNDRIKSNYAKDKGIPLLRVRYDQKSPEKLIQHVLQNHFIQKKSTKNLVA